MKILLIDDDLFFRKFYTTKLEEAEYTVVTAEDGEDGLKKIQQGTYDLILLDIIMPKKNGFEVLQEIKQQNLAKNTSIIVFSTLDQEKDLEEAKRLGAVDYINKAATDWDSILAKISSYMPQ